jgi:hypothetical protein
MLTGESRFHERTPLRIEPGSLMPGSKWVDHWTSEIEVLHRLLGIYLKYFYIKDRGICRNSISARHQK